MLLSNRKSGIILSTISGFLVDLPSPSSLSYLWNFGSLLGVFLGFQILTGLFLSMQFSGSVDLSFDSVIYIMRDVNGGWLLRVLHANGASFFFLFLYFHIGRGLYYGSYRFIEVWMSGVSIFLLSMGAAFLGYVLPWGQMSFWAATVITNLLSVIPYVGVLLVEWIWGGFSVGNSTLIRFFSFHFLLPFLVLVLVVLHLVFLHESGSNNPLGLLGDNDKIAFHPYFSVKDILGLMLFGWIFMEISLIYPFIFMDVENFILSNPMVTPVHIQPEWYFLFAYTILRSISSKMGGVMALFCSVFIIYLIPFIMNFRFRSGGFYFMFRLGFWIFLVNWIMLTWIGACEVDFPFMQIGMICSFIYFLMFFMFSWVGICQDLLLWLY